MIGIAVGNGDREVQDFAKRYKVTFPIIPDPNFAMHRAIGGSRTPFTIMLRFDPSNMTGIVAETHLGQYRKHKSLFKKVKNGKIHYRALDLQPGGGCSFQSDHHLVYYL
jgi:hypothetical protein